MRMSSGRLRDIAASLSEQHDRHCGQSRRWQTRLLLRPGRVSPRYVWSELNSVPSQLSSTAPTKCIHNNKQYMNREKWKSDKCTTCECRDGITFCQKKECKAVANCKAVVVISDECCPTCQGITAFPLILSMKSIVCLSHSLSSVHPIPDSL